MFAVLYVLMVLRGAVFGAGAGFLARAGAAAAVAAIATAAAATPAAAAGAAAATTQQQGRALPLCAGARGNVHCACSANLDAGRQRRHATPPAAHADVVELAGQGTVWRLRGRRAPVAQERGLQEASHITHQPCSARVQ